ncbi:hypothetical protein TWF481_000694 [Arthrobotrys musiformis]|uniref:Uncharacterized protein n=1 Tax=Arthrobotrys musiformis TaxID=47236 RepID=A0AAV9WNB6_9PEZI
MSNHDAVPIFIYVNIGGNIYGIRAAVPDTLQLPIEEKALDLPLDSRLVVFGWRSVGPGDRDANWNLFRAGSDKNGPYFKLQCRGGPAMQYTTDEGTKLIVPKLVNQVPLIGGKVEYWRLIPTTGDQFLIQSTANGLFWSVSKNGRNWGSVQPQRLNDPRFIQSFTLAGVNFGGINDNRPN